ncbi:MAG: molybdopterin-dependent oxidoreductase [Anaerolineae bacterium]|nr:molybdopterin-dependent oxidoreductase [Anaerolineae bacterium]
MTNSIGDLANDSRCIFIIGSNTTENHPVIGTKIRRATRERGVKLIVADPRRIDITDHADLWLRHRPGTDIALLNGLMHVILRDGMADMDFIDTRTEGFDEFRAVVEQYTPEVASRITGVPAEQIEQAAHMMGENRPGALVYAMGITQHATGVANVMSCANIQMLLGNMGVAGGGVNPLRGQNNVQGACDMGGLPNVYAGYQNVTLSAVREKFEAAGGVPLSDKVGLTVTEMLDGAERGDVRCLYIIGENPMVSDPDLRHVQHSLDRTEFIVVQELFFSETCHYADVILPAAAFSEKEGTFTNTERRIQRVRKAVEPPGEAQRDSWIVKQLASRLLALGAATPDLDAPWADWEYDSPEDAMDEINALTPIYGGITYRRLEAGAQLQWPVPDKTHPGTPILHATQFSRGKGRFAAVDHIPPAEQPDAEYPTILTTGRVIYHWHGGEMTRRAEGLLSVYPEALVEISLEDAQKLGVHDGDMVRVTSRRGSVEARAQLNGRVSRGLVFSTFHFPAASVNWLTSAEHLDPLAKIPEFKVTAVRLEKVGEPVSMR